MRQNKGVTLTILVITVLVMILIISITIAAAGDLIEKSKMADYIGYMELVKARADNVIEENVFEDNTGDFRIIDSKAKMQSYYKTNEFKAKYDNIDLNQYKFVAWQKEDIATQGINSDILIGNSFFLIAYNTSKMEVEDIFYSKGCKLDGKTYYSLNEMQVILGK